MSMSVASVTSAATAASLLWDDKDCPKWDVISQDMSSKRKAAAAVAIDNEYMVVLGGSNAKGMLANAEVYQDNKSWIPLPSMPTARDGCAAVFMPHNRTIVVLGGEDNYSSYLATAEMLKWKDKEWTTLPSMLMPRFGAAAVALNDQLIVLGGSNESTSLNSVEMYQEGVGSWKELPSMSTARAWCMAAVVDDKIYVFGGGGSGGENTAEVYHNGEWSTLPPMPSPRKRGAAVAVGSKIVLLGGSDGNKRLKTVDMFDTQTQTWTCLPSMNTKRNHCVAAYLHNQIVVSGGYNGEYLDGAERLVLDKIFPTPSEIPPMPLVVGRQQRKTVLEEWIDKAVATKEEYLQKVDVVKRHMDETFHAGMDELEKQMQSLLEKKASSNEDKVRFFKVLESTRDDWVDGVDEQIEDAKDQLEALRVRMDAPRKRARVDDDGGDQREQKIDPLPLLLCPISKKLMTDPVFAADGHTYGRAAIEELIAKVPEDQDVVSPVTGEPLAHRIVTTNMSILRLVQSYQEQNGKMVE